MRLRRRLRLRYGQGFALGMWGSVRVEPPMVEGSKDADFEQWAFDAGYAYAMTMQGLGVRGGAAPGASPSSGADRG